jgi:hypothetical protein
VAECGTSSKSPASEKRHWNLNGRIPRTGENWNKKNVENPTQKISTLREYYFIFKCFY